MGCWNTGIKDNDTTLDVYTFFFDKYNNGEEPRNISKIIREDFSDYFTDYDDKNNALFGFALAQWETKCLDPENLYEVRKIVESEDDLKFWGEDKRVLSGRKKVLVKFLNQISTERPKPMRRQRPKFEYKNVEIVKAIAPDNKKEFVITDEYVNGKYIHTQGIMTWYSGSGSGILSYNYPNAEITAKWKHGNDLEISYISDIEFSEQERKYFMSGDQGSIEYKKQTNLKSGG